MQKIYPTSGSARCITTVIKNPHRRLENPISTDSDLEHLIGLDCVRLEKAVTS